MSKNLPQKMCARCGRPFDWRKKWARCWEEVRFCSERCKGEARGLRRAANGPRGGSPAA